MSNRVLIQTEFSLPINRYDDIYTGEFSWVWPKDCWEELQKFLKENPEKEICYTELYGKHSMATVSFKDLLQGTTIVENAEKIESFLLQYGFEHDFSEEFDAWDEFLEQVGCRHNECYGVYPKWWDYSPSKEEETFVLEIKHTTIKKHLKASWDCLPELNILPSEEAKAQFDDYILNNELELAWEVIRDIFVSKNPFSHEMSKAAELMDLDWFKC